MLKIFYEVENYIVLLFLMYSNVKCFPFKDIISSTHKYFFLVTAINGEDHRPINLSFSHNTVIEHLTMAICFDTFELQQPVMQMKC